MAAQPGVVEVHDLHVWEVTSEFPALSAHVIVEPDADCHRTRLELAELIEREFGIHHTTLQVEHEPEHLVQIDALSCCPRRRPRASRGRGSRRAGSWRR